MKSSPPPHPPPKKKKKENGDRQFFKALGYLTFSPITLGVRVLSEMERFKVFPTFFRGTKGGRSAR